MAPDIATHGAAEDDDCVVSAVVTEVGAKEVALMSTAEPGSPGKVFKAEAVMSVETVECHEKVGTQYGYVRCVVCCLWWWLYCGY